MIVVKAAAAIDVVETSEIGVFPSACLDCSSPSLPSPTVSEPDVASILPTSSQILSISSLVLDEQTSTSPSIYSSVAQEAPFTTSSLITNIVAETTSETLSPADDLTQTVDSAVTPTEVLSSTSPAQTSDVDVELTTSAPLLSQTPAQSPVPTPVSPSTPTSLPRTSIASLYSGLELQALPATSNRNSVYMDVTSKSTLFFAPTSTRMYKTFYAATPTEITLLITDALAQTGLVPTLQPTSVAPWDIAFTQVTARFSSSAPGVAGTNTPFSPDSSSPEAGKKRHTVVMIMGCLLAFICISILGLCLVLRRRNQTTAPPMTIEKRLALAGLGSNPVSPATTHQQKYKSFTDVDLDDHPPSPISSYGPPSPNLSSPRLPSTPLVQESTQHEELHSRFSATSSEYNASLGVGDRFSRQSRNLMNLMFSSIVRRPTSMDAPAPLLSPREFFTLPTGGDGPHRRWDELSQHAGWSDRGEKGEKERWSNSDMDSIV